MIIDSHVHLVDWDGDRSTESLVRLATRHGIAPIVCSCLGVNDYVRYPTPEQVTAANDYLLREMRVFAEDVVGLCYACPSLPELSLREIDRCVAQGPMKGIKLWVDTKASDPSVEPIARRAIELGVPILQHAFYKTTGNLENETTPWDVAVLAAKFPELRIQMAHLHGCGYQGINDIAPYPNVSVDTSGSEPEAGVLDRALCLLGSGRILFGSDAPGRGYGVQLGKVLGTEMDQEDRNRIRFKNARELYKL